MRRIELTQGKVAIVDNEDFEKVNQYSWCASLESRGTKWYAVRWCRMNGKSRKVRMHRFILGLPTGFEDERVVDHLNHDSLDNRKCNLEVIDQAENMRRSIGWKKKRVHESPYL